MARIIGKVSDSHDRVSGVVVEMSLDELANIMGYQYSGEMRCTHKIFTGKEIKVSDLWRLLSRLRSLPTELDSVRKVLAGCNATLEPIEQQVSRMVTEPKDETNNG